MALLIMHARIYTVQHVDVHHVGWKLKKIECAYMPLYYLGCNKLVSCVHVLELGPE